MADGKLDKGESTMTTKILIADDHRIVREGLKHLLEKESSMEVVGEAKTGREAVEMAGKLKPAVVIMDITMPELNGIEATRQILTELPNTKVIVLSMHSDKRFVSKMLSAGACGYLLKDCALEELVDAVQAVVNGSTFLSSRVIDVVVKDYVTRVSDTDSEGAPVISPREIEVLQMLAEGKTAKQIAMKLHISVKTVETHRRRIMDKLNVNSIAELTKFAIREGLTPL